MPATATDPTYAAALADLTREFAETFGETTVFATTRQEGEEWETNGRKFKRSGGKTVRVKGDRSGGSGKPQPPKPADAAKPAEPPKSSPPAEAPKPPPPASSRPAPPAEPPPPSPGATGVAKTGTTPRGTRITLKPYQKPRPMAPGDPAVASVAKLPPAAPAEKSHYDAARKADAAKYGPRAAGILSRAAEAVRGFLTLGGLTGGAYLGATVGTALGGPLGTAVGTAVGGGLGGLLGRASPAVARKAYSLATQKGRARALVRRGVRKVLPKAAGMTVEATGLGTTRRVAQAVGRRLATSAVSRRKVEQGEFAESFTADDGLPPNAVAILKARLRVAASKAGVTLPPVPDEVVAAALRMASQDSATGAAAEALAEVGMFSPGRRGGKKVTKFRAKPFKMPITPMPVFRPKGGIGMFAEVMAAVESARA